MRSSICQIDSFDIASSLACSNSVMICKVFQVPYRQQGYPQIQAVQLYRASDSRFSDSHAEWVSWHQELHNRCQPQISYHESVI